jgi:hypothetical protein
MSDELIYKIKLVVDDKSLAEVKRQVNEVQSTKTTSGGRGGQGTEKEISVLKQLRAELKNYQNDLSDIQAEAKRTAGATIDNLNVQRSLGTAISEVRAQIQEATRGYADQQTAISTIPTTYNELVEQNRALSIAMRDVPLDDTTGKLKELQEQYAQNNVKLKEFDASIGNNQRSVGNYKLANEGLVDSLRSLSNGLAIVQGPLGPIAGRINSAATFLVKMSKSSKDAEKTQKGLGHVLKGNIPLIVAKTGATTASAVATKGANVAIKGLNVTLKVLRLTLISLGIPAIAIAIFSLIQAFKRTEEGAGKLRVIMAGANATLDVFKDILSNIGRLLIEAFENPQQAVKDLWEVIKENIVNRFTAIPKIIMGVFSTITKGGEAAAEAIKGIFSAEARENAKKLFAEAKQELSGLANATGQLFTGIEDPITKLVDGISKIKDEIDRDSEAAKELERNMNAVLIREREIGVERAQQNRDLQQARVTARDMEVDARTRLKAVLEVGEAERLMSEKELENERERLRIMEEKAKLSDTNEATLNAIAEQQQKVFALEALSLQKIMSLIRDRNTNERQIREEAVREARFRFEMEESQQKIEQDRLRTNLEREGRLREALQIELTRITDTQSQERARLEEVYLAEFLNQKFKQEDAERMAKEKAEKELAERIYNAQKAFDDRVIQERISADAFDRGLVEQRRVFALKQAQDELNSRGMQLQALRLLELDTEEGIAKRRNEIRTQLEQQYRDQNMEPAEAARRAEAEAQMQTDQEVHDFKMNLARMEQDNRLQMAQQLSSGLSAINSAFFEESKELAVASAIMDTYAAIVKALAAPPGFPLNIGGVIAAGATGMANVKKILSTKLGSKSVTADKPKQPNVTTSFGLVDVGTNAPMASQIASNASMPRQNMNPTFVFTGDLDPEIMSIKVRQGANAISGKTIGIGI